MTFQLPPGPIAIDILRNAYVSGDITPGEVVREIIQRADSDEDMHIWITPPSMERIRPYLERLTLLDPADLPLWGIPFAIKDNIDWAGVPTTAACPDYAYTPTQHATVVARLIAAGAIPLGKTNLDQFATGLVGTRSPYGEVHNAHKPALISGGSSSGSAVAVARGQAVFALGTDTAGSGRIPASLNGLVGYKPPLGAWPTKGVVPACASLDCVTAFTATVSDASAIDKIVRGLDTSDPWSRRIKTPASAIPGRLLLPNPDAPLTFFGPYAAQYERAWQHTVARLQRLGLPITYIDLQPYADAAALLYDGPYVEERRASLGSFIEAHPGSALPVTETVLLSGMKKQYDAASVFRAMHTLQELKRKAASQFQDAVLVLPTAGGTWTREQVAAEPIATNSQMGLYTNHCNLLGLTALAVPAGEAADQLPFGITFFSSVEDEDCLYGVADMWNQPKQAHETFLTIAVCGLHMRGFPLEQQMLDYQARYLRTVQTAAKYALFKLDTTPVKPGLMKQTEGGTAIEVELWEMPAASFGKFTAAIPAPLGIGKIELQDGTEVSGFLCEAYAASTAENVSFAGGWRAVISE